MRSKIIPKSWNYYFIIGSSLIIVHLIRYINFLMTGAFPWSDNHADYFVLTSNYFYIQLLLLISVLLISKFRKEFPVLANGTVWLILWLLLSHQHDKFTFLLIPLITIISFYSSFYYRINEYKR